MTVYYIEIRFKVKANTLVEAEEKLDEVINSQYYDEATDAWEELDD